MYYLEDLKEMLCKELEEIAEKGELSAGMLETVHKLTDSIKNIDKIEMLEDGGYSEESRWMGEGRMYGTSYGNEGGNTYARGRGRNAKRDGMGRYSRDGGYGGDNGGSYGGGSSYRGGRGGYSRAEGKEHMIGKLEEMMGMTESEEERKAIRQCIQKLENA